MRDVSSLVAMARRVFPNASDTIGEVEATVASVASARPIALAGLESAPAPVSTGELFSVPRSEMLDTRLREGMRGLDKARRGNTDLTPGEHLGLEAIVLLFGRPALLVQDGDFGTPPAEWSILNQRRDVLKKTIPSVGRVELDGHHTFPWCGTAFVVGDGILMTNRHVAEVFSERSGKLWKFLRGVKARIDYKEEYQRDGSSDFKVDKVLTIHPAYDLALLRVVKNKKAPAPLAISAKAPKSAKDRDVAVIGYPAFDSRNGQDAQLDIFKNIYNVKRLQPGKTTGLTKGTAPVLGHDCSTLGGNSGSCVVDIDTGKVVGLHFGGQYLKGNVSVPLWKLKEDKVLRKFELNWV